ncbi:MAG: 4Fe-4S dicluster domain-containing protein [Candidatus Eremiobacteraeota bacterium]|nr:4Fe-4S dicluster domain-containing protein [Candidatus Eremiobacteraeota bacterium]
MSIRVNPDLLKEIKRYGAFDISACFNCGNCTAVCPLADEKGSFPRKLIRLGQVGSEAKLLESPEMWFCYYCGECSLTCPRSAEPGEYMASLRRFAVSKYEPTGLAGLLFKYAAVNLLVSSFLMVLLGCFFITMKASDGSMHQYSHWLFSMVPYEVIHHIGIIISVFFAITLIVGVASMLRGVFGRSLEVLRAFSLKDHGRAAFRVIREILTMERHRKCASDTMPVKAWPVSDRFIHQCIMFGYLGLLLATTLDFFFIVVFPLGMIPFWPARLSGIAGGLLMMYGVTAAIVKRLMKRDKNAEHTRFSDWWPLVVSWAVGFTGFWLTAVVTVIPPGTGDTLPRVHNLMLLLHVAMAMMLVLMWMGTKLSHAIYRPLALFRYFLEAEKSMKG